MTDQISALSALVDVPGAERDAALAEFYEQWKHEPLVMLKWLGIQVWLQEAPAPAGCAQHDSALSTQQSASPLQRRCMSVASAASELSPHASAACERRGRAGCCILLCRDTYCCTLPCRMLVCCSRRTAVQPSMACSHHERDVHSRPVECHTFVAVLGSSGHDCWKLCCCALTWWAWRSQTRSNAPSNLEAVKALEQHSAFSMTNPNSCYALYLGFSRSAVNFHAADGSGYEFVADAAIKVRRPLLPRVLTSPACLQLLLTPPPVLLLRAAAYCFSF
jgi:hypothetical protein